MSTPTDTPDVDAITVAVVTAALWLDGVPLGTGEDGETGDLQHLTVPDEGRAVVAGYVRAFLAAADPADIAAFAEDAAGHDPWDDLGHALYLDAAGHGSGFWDGRMRTPAGDRLHGVARRTCGAFEHATFAQEDESTASVDLPPAVEEVEWADVKGKRPVVAAGLTDDQARQRARELGAGHAIARHFAQTLGGSSYTCWNVVGPAVETLTVNNAWTGESRVVRYQPTTRPGDSLYFPMTGDLVTVPGDGYTTPGGRLYVVDRHYSGIPDPGKDPKPGVVGLRPCGPSGKLEGEAGNIVTTHAGQIRPWQAPAPAVATPGADVRAYVAALTPVPAYRACPCCGERVGYGTRDNSPYLHHGRDRLSGAPCPREGMGVDEATRWDDGSECRYDDPELTKGASA